jgi:chromosome segregation ATPase
LSQQLKEAKHELTEATLRNDSLRLEKDSAISYYCHKHEESQNHILAAVSKLQDEIANMRTHISRQDNTIKDQANTIREQGNTIREQGNTIAEQVKATTQLQRNVEDLQKDVSICLKHSIYYYIGLAGELLNRFAAIGEEGQVIHGRVSKFSSLTSEKQAIIRKLAPSISMTLSSFEMANEMMELRNNTIHFGDGPAFQAKFSEAKVDLHNLLDNIKHPELHERLQVPCILFDIYDELFTVQVV